MRRIIFAGFAAFLLGSAALASPAEARCWSNGYAWHCWHPHGWWGYRHHYWHRYAWGWHPYAWRYHPSAWRY
jgi:hypothetical protein